MLGFALLQECRSRWAPLESQEPSHHLEPEKGWGEGPSSLTCSLFLSPCRQPPRAELGSSSFCFLNGVLLAVSSHGSKGRLEDKASLPCLVSQRSLQPLPRDTQGPFSVFTLMVPCSTRCSPSGPLAPLTLLPGPLLCQSVQGRSPRSCPQGRARGAASSCTQTLKGISPPCGSPICPEVLVSLQVQILSAGFTSQLVLHLLLHFINR